MIILISKTLKNMDLNKECIHLPGYHVKYQTSPIDGIYMYVCVCEFVSTVNRGHALTLHHQTKDNIANEDAYCCI